MRTLIRTALALAFLVGISPPLVAGTEPVCLLTGFEPFGGSKINPLWEVAKSLDGRRIGGFKVVSRQLPVVYDKVGVALENAIAETKPDMVISLGVGSSVIQIEKMARNGYHPKKIKDNAGLAPPREEIIPGGKATLETALPVEGILASLSKASIGARSSTNAGGYLCNECFYRLMAQPPLPMRGFVHVPQLDSADPSGGTFTLEKLKQAVEIIIQTASQATALAPR